MNEINFDKLRSAAVDLNNPTQEKQQPKQEEPKYTGTGVVISKESYDNMIKQSTQNGINVNPISGDSQRMEDVKNYMDDLDQQIAEQRKLAKKNLESGQQPQNQQKSNIQEVQILIDKTGLGKIEFTDEEKSKLEVTEKIRLIEVSEESLRSVNIVKNTKDKNLGTIARKIFDRSKTSFVNLGSGYCGKIGNISAHEAVTIIDNEGDPSAENLLEKWSVIYEKIAYTSIGNFDSFDHFLKETAMSDLPGMIYAVTVASYPDNDNLTVTCGNAKCRHTFKHPYKLSELVRKDHISDNMMEKMENIVSNQTILENALKIHNESPVKTVKRVSLDPNNDIIVDITIPSAYEFIERNHRLLNENYRKNTSYTAQINMLGFIKKVLMRDINGYIEIIEPNDIMKYVLLNLTEYQTRRLYALTEKLSEDITFDFGIESITCPKCNQTINDYNIPVELLLFLQVRRLMNMEIE